MSMIELNMDRPSIAERSTVNFAETRSITPATKRLYDGAAMVPYGELTRILETHRFVFLYRDKVLTATLGKSNFVKGTARELVQHLRDTTQASYRYMK